MRKLAFKHSNVPQSLYATFGVRECAPRLANDKSKKNPTTNLQMC